MPQSLHIKALLLFIVFLISCQQKEKSDNSKRKQPGSTSNKIVFNADSVKKQFIKANKQIVQKESDEMDYYVKSHQMPFIKTNSGIRYYVYKASAKGDSIKNGDIVSMSYKVSLLDGTMCYSSKENENKIIKVGEENIESGIHRALLFLKRGDKALILLPSHLAHGLLGDMKKIPPQMPIVYDIEVK